MHRAYVAWHSPSLGRTMELLVFGHAGEPVITFPTSCGKFFEWEDFGMTRTLAGALDAGRVQLFCLDSVDAESWYNRGVHPETRIARDDDYDRYLVHEVVPFVASRNPGPLTLAGASFGGYHAIDKGLRHPDVFKKLLSLSGAYDLSWFLSGHRSAGTHLRQPLSYLPTLDDAWFLERMRAQDIRLAIGEHDFLLDQNRRLASALRQRRVGHQLDVWGGYDHDWPAWRGMLAKHVG
jgi:esterase/lipase superfamily enzyme